MKFNLRLIWESYFWDPQIQEKKINGNFQHAVNLMTNFLFKFLIKYSLCAWQVQQKLPNFSSAKNLMLALCLNLFCNPCAFAFTKGFKKKQHLCKNSNHDFSYSFMSFSRFNVLFWITAILAWCKKKQSFEVISDKNAFWSHGFLFKMQIYASILTSENRSNKVCIKVNYFKTWIFEDIYHDRKCLIKF